MNPLMLKHAAVLALITFLGAVASLVWVYQNSRSELIGNLVFAETDDQIGNIAAINIRTPQSNISLVLDNEFWRVKEADYYYAGFDLMRSLFENIKTSRFQRRQAAGNADYDKYKLNNPYQTSADAGTSISILNAEGQELNHLIIGRRDADNLFQFARIPGRKQTAYLLSGQYILPAALSSWTQQPLLNLDAKDIQSIAINGKSVKRPDSAKPFLVFHENKPLKLIRTEKLFKQLAYLSYDQVISAQNFDETRFPIVKSVKITTFDGMIASLDLFTDNNNFWIRLSLSTTALPTTATNDYIKNNAFLYDGWFFQLPPDAGKALSQFDI